MRTYGKLFLAGINKDNWIVSDIQPHVAIRLKHLFPRLKKTDVAPFKFPNDTIHCADLDWFMSRYPLEIETSDIEALKFGRGLFEKEQADLEQILMPDYASPSYTGLNDGQEIRLYQSQAIEIGYRSRALLIGDDLGLGKSYTGIGFCLKPGTLPAAIVVQTHLQQQWAEKISSFTNLRFHKITKTKPYDLPPADIYIFKYTQIAGWVDVLGTTGFFKTAIYDEIQELRRGQDSQKGQAACKLSSAVDFKLGLSATPIYGYGGEIWNIYQALDPLVLGCRGEFMREWCEGSFEDKAAVKNPEALGAYLRERHVFIRRTKSDVGQQLLPVNIINETVESDGKAIKDIEHIARELAMRALTGSFTERGHASRELDLRVRQATGVGKANSVAAHARIMLENNIPILLVGWHRDVYSIWLEELAEFNPAMYTGSESPKQKEESVKKFLSNETNLFIISLRSGAGLDGLQHRCSTVIFGELDWSKKVHEQVIGRLDREGQTEQVMAIYCTSEDGSDPPMIDVLALKESQSRGIIDMRDTFEGTTSDDSRIKAIARMFLSKRDMRDIESPPPKAAENLIYMEKKNDIQTALQFS